MKTFARSLQRISSMAGMSDAAEACRQIIKECKRVLTNTGFHPQAQGDEK